MKHRLLFAATLLLLSSATLADTWKDCLSFGGEFGVWKQVGGERDYSNVDQFGNVKIRYTLTAPWTLDLGLKYGWTRPGVDIRGADAGITFDSGTGFYTRTWQPHLTTTYRLIANGRWSPWVSAGAGVTRWDVRDLNNGESPGLWPDGQGVRVYNQEGDSLDGHGVDFTLILGLGAEIAVSNHWTFDVGLRYNARLGQSIDSVGFSGRWGPDHVDANAGIIEGFIGVNYLFGKRAKKAASTPRTEEIVEPIPENTFPEIDEVITVPVTEENKDSEVDGSDESVTEMIDPYAIPDRLVLRDVLFQPGSSELVNSSLATLNDIATKLHARPEIFVEVAGYTDNSGSSLLNRRLSQERAESVRDYLISQGVPSFRITAKGYGEDNPIADNATAEGRAANRRVELRRVH